MAIKSYASTCNTQLTKNFNVKEFKCKCGKNHTIKISDELVNKLQELVDKVNCSMAVLSSGYRCATHDRNVGGNGRGPHCDGYAVDIIFYDKNNKPISSKIISCIAQDMGFTGIANITSRYDYIHLDMKGRIYRGNEIGGNYNTVTSDFYKYYNLAKEFVYSTVGAVSTTASTTTKLNTKDKNTKSFTYTNKYDPQIMELQKILNDKGSNLSVDGIAGPKTYTEVKKFTIEKGDRGPLTCWVQKRLTDKGYKPGLTDGIAGISTMNAIKQFQKDNKLGQGYLGGTDWYHLIK